LDREFEKVDVVFDTRSERDASTVSTDPDDIAPSSAAQTKLDL